jgi:hypothetical protein
MVPLLAVSLAALPTHAQDAAPRPGTQSAQAAASNQAATPIYQCAVTTKDAGVERTIIRAASEAAAKSAAVKKFGSRSTGLAGVSCVATAASAAAPSGSLARSEEVKTRAATPTPFDPIRAGVEFLSDGSCRLSQQAVVSHPDARQHCQSDPSSKGVTFGCPVKYCETLR